MGKKAVASLSSVFFIVSEFVGLGFCLLLTFAGEHSPRRNSVVGPEYVIPANH